MNWLFDTSSFVPRAECGDWPSWLVIFAVASNIGIAAAYYFIPFNLYLFYKKKRIEYSTSWIILLFVAFIASCGTTHLIDAIMYKWPAYRLLVFTDVITAIISLLTAYYLPKVLRQLATMQSLEELTKLNAELQTEIERRKEIEGNVRTANHDLANQVNILNQRLRVQGWIGEKQVEIDELKRIVTDLRKSYAGTDKASS